MADRKSEAEIPPLISDQTELAKREASNALEQFDWGMSEVEACLGNGTRLLKVSTLLNLHRRAMNGIDRYAGNFRPAGVGIKGSTHKPVEGHDVPERVEEMLDYLRDNWDKQTAYHLSAYAMWRLNWIHPFADGNGRTSRIFSYMVLCAKLGQILRGVKTIPEQIASNKEPYYKALEAADGADAVGRIDVSEMEGLLTRYLTTQLLYLHRRANGEEENSRMGVGNRRLPGVKRDSIVLRAGRTAKRNVIEILEKHPVMVAIVIGVITIIVSIFSR